MTIPSLLLGCVIAALLGAAAHLILGGGLGRLVLFLFIGLVAFWFGHVLGMILEIKFLNLGAIHLGTALPVTLIALAVTAWLSAIDRSGE
ncbi:MAG: hypothetical protein ACK2T7_13670 [Anaerolineales bacterium]